MDIHCVFVQVPCSYPGEFAPELYAAADEYSVDSNPGYLDKKEKEAMGLLAAGEYTHLRRIVITVDNKDFDRMFFGEPLKGSVQKGGL
jgi:hypothetical protein